MQLIDLPQRPPLLLAAHAGLSISDPSAKPLPAEASSRLCFLLLLLRWGWQEMGGSQNIQLMLHPFLSYSEGDPQPAVSRPSSSEPPSGPCPKEGQALCSRQVSWARTS